MINLCSQCLPLSLSADRQTLRPKVNSGLEPESAALRPSAPFWGTEDRSDGPSVSPLRSWSCEAFFGRTPRTTPLRDTSFGQLSSLLVIFILPLLAYSEGLVVERQIPKAKETVNCRQVGFRRSTSVHNGQEPRQERWRTPGLIPNSIAVFSYRSRMYNNVHVEVARRDIGNKRQEKKKFRKVRRTDQV